MTTTDNLPTSFDNYQNKYIFLKLKPTSDLSKHEGIDVVVGRLITVYSDYKSRYLKSYNTMVIRNTEGLNIEVKIDDIERIIQF